MSGWTDNERVPGVRNRDYSKSVFGVVVPPGVQGWTTWGWEVWAGSNMFGSDGAETREAAQRACDAAGREAAGLMGEAVREPFLICRAPGTAPPSSPCAPLSGLCTEPEAPVGLHRWDITEYTVLSPYECVLCGAASLGFMSGTRTSEPGFRYVLIGDPNGSGHAHEVGLDCPVPDPIRAREPNCSKEEREGVAPERYPHKRWWDRKTWWMRRCDDTGSRVDAWCAAPFTPLRLVLDAILHSTPLLEVAIKLGADPEAQIHEALAWEEAFHVDTLRSRLDDIGVETWPPAWSDLERLWEEDRAAREKDRARERAIEAAIPPDAVLWEGFNKAKAAMDFLLDGCGFEPLPFAGDVGLAVARKAVTQTTRGMHDVWVDEMRALGHDERSHLFLVDHKNVGDQACFDAWLVMMKIVRAVAKRRKDEGKW